MVVREVVRDLIGEPTNARPQAATRSVVHLDAISDLDEEVVDLERKRQRDKRLSERDIERLEELERTREKEARAFRDAKQQEILVEAKSNDVDYLAPALDDSTVHILQYHMGQVVFEKRCWRCSFPMVLQHQWGTNLSIQQFFWQCTKYYTLSADEQKDPTNKHNQSFSNSDISLIHRVGVPELEAKREDLELITAQSFVQQTIKKRVADHLGDQDDEILCPVHYLAMTLREKRENNGTLTDMYYLKCPHQGCSQTVKLKSVAQIAAYLRRQEGQGLL